MMKRRKQGQRRGMTLAELMIVVALLSSITLITTVLYQNLQGTVTRSNGEMEATSQARLALDRVEPLLESAYVPPISGANSPIEPTVLAPYAAGDPEYDLQGSAARTPSSTDRLAATGPGSDSLLFYSCNDLFDASGALPVPGNTPSGYPVNPTPVAGEKYDLPHLYEIRLMTKADAQALGIAAPGEYDDPTGFGRTRRTLVLTEMNLPSTFGGTSFTRKSPLKLSKLVTGLADFRMTRQTSSGVRLVAFVQHRTATVGNDKRNHALGKRPNNSYDTVANLHTYALSGVAMMPVVCLK